MAALIDAITVKRKTLFEFENTPFCCLEAEVNTPTARGGQTLVRLKMRNLLTNAVFEKTFKASDKFKEPDLQSVQASYLYSDGDGSHFLDQESYETLTLDRQHGRGCIGLPDRRRVDRVAQVQRQSHWDRAADIRRTECCFHGTRSARRLVGRQRPNLPAWKQVWKFASPSSSKKGKR